MKLWLYRVWFDRDNNEISPIEEEGTIIKAQIKGQNSFTQDLSRINDVRGVEQYFVEYDVPYRGQAFVYGRFINTDEPIYEHVPSDIENMTTEGTDYYYMGFTYSKEQSLSEVVTRKRKCISTCNEKILDELKKRKSELESSIKRLQDLNHFGGNED